MTYPRVRKRTESKATLLLREQGGGRWFESSHPDQCLQGAAFPGSLFHFALLSSSAPDSSSI